MEVSIEQLNILKSCIGLTKDNYGDIRFSMVRNKYTSVGPNIALLDLIICGYMESVANTAIYGITQKGIDLLSAIYGIEDIELTKSTDVVMF